MIARAYTTFRDKVRGKDLLEEVWLERDSAEAESIRERIERLRIMEKQAEETAKRLEEAGLKDGAKEEKRKARHLHRALSKLAERKRELDLRIVTEQARYYREGHG